LCDVKTQPAVYFPITGVYMYFAIIVASIEMIFNFIIGIFNTKEKEKELCGN
jgi:hypothetical protein